MFIYQAFSVFLNFRVMFPEFLLNHVLKKNIIQKITHFKFSQIEEWYLLTLNFYLPMHGPPIPLHPPQNFVGQNYFLHLWGDKIIWGSNIYYYIFIIPFL